MNLNTLADEVKELLEWTQPEDRERPADFQGKVQRLADMISQQTREHMMKQYPNYPPNVMDRDTTVKVSHGPKYTKMDVGHSGKYMIDRDGTIFGIKGYGVIHRGHHYGTLDTIDDYHWGDFHAYKKKVT